MKRLYNQKISRNTEQCESCGLVKGHCICDYDIDLKPSVQFFILSHENELTRTNNTARLIERAIPETKTFVWSRTNPPEVLIDMFEEYRVYLVFSDDREEEKKRAVKYKVSTEKVAFLILDGTWKEARKMLRKSDYLNSLPILPLKPTTETLYDLRRNNDEGHLCTVEVAVELLKLVGDTSEGKALEDYFKYYMKRYHDGKYQHREVKND